MARKTTVTENNIDMPTKPKRTTAADYKKRIAELEDANNQLVNKVGEITGLYLNALAKYNKAADKEREVATKILRNIVSMSMGAYGLSPADILS